jgi:hypothetical protein
MKNLPRGLSFALFLAGSVYGAAVPITPSQLGQQTVHINSYTYLFSGTGAGGGAFNEQIGPYNATIWCVDSQLTAAGIGSNYTAYIEDLNGYPAAFDSNHVRYENITTLGGSGWTYSFAVGSGNYTGGNHLGAAQNTDAQIRYRLAAILISQYVPNDGAPLDNAQNNSIQDAIWELTAHNGHTINQSINVNNPSGNNWIDYAIGILNAGTFDFNQWAVVSGGWNPSTYFSGQTAYQTFLVQVTPEPRFYGLLLVGVLSLCGLLYHRKAESRL